MTISGQSKPCVGLEGATSLTDFYKEHPKYQDVESDYEGLGSRNEKIYVRVCDITTVQADAIVCPTQTDFQLPSFGLCTKVWSVGGPVLKHVCLRKKRLSVGTSFTTNGYNLPAKNVIFTAGPAPDAPYNKEERLDILRNNYTSSLDVLTTHADIRTVAFPCLGTGGGGLDMTDANRVAAKAIRDWLDIEANRSSVDAILLCMFSQEQWNDYFPELLKAFPYSLDLQGNNLESLKDVAQRYLQLPPCSVSTNILCYKYQPMAGKTLKRHFHKLVDLCVQTLKHAVKLSRRFRNCAILMHKRNCDHQVIIYHSDKMHMIEVQVTRFNDHIDTIREDICKDLNKCITDYFETNLDNMTTLEYYLRCDQSTWAQEDGLWACGETAGLSEGRQTCSKHELARDFHPILCKDLLQYWKISSMNLLSPRPCDTAASGREPVEHSLVEHSLSSFNSQVPDREPSSVNTSMKRALSLSFSRSVEENDTASPSSSTSVSSPNWSVPTTPESVTRVKTDVPCPHEHTASTQSNQEKGKRKKTKIGDRLNRHEKTRETETVRYLVVPDDSGNETESQFSSQVSIRSQDIQNIQNTTLCRNLANKDLMKLAKHMGSYQKRIGLCLELTEADIQNAMGRGEKDTELQGYYILRKWMSVNDASGGKADIDSLLKVYLECDIDIYQVRQDLGII